MSKAAKTEKKRKRKTPIGAIVYITLDGKNDDYAKQQNVPIYKGEHVLFLCDAGSLAVRFKRDTPTTQGHLLWAAKGQPLRVGPMFKKALPKGKASARYDFALTVTKPSGKEIQVDPGLIIEVMNPDVKTRPDGQPGCVGCYRWSAAPPPPKKG